MHIFTEEGNKAEEKQNIRIQEFLVTVIAGGGGGSPIPMADFF